MTFTTTTKPYLLKWIFEFLLICTSKPKKANDRGFLCLDKVMIEANYSGTRMSA